MNLLILTADDRLEKDRYRVADHRAKHIRSVLKLAPGDRLEVGLLNGPLGTAVVESTSPDGVTIHTENLTTPVELFPVIDLICALPRPQTLKKVLSISAMMGVRRIFLVRANRVEKSYFQSPLLHPANYQRRLIDGLSQGKLTRLPDLSIHDRFRTFFEDTLPAAVAAEEQSDRVGPIMLLPDQAASATLTDCWKSVAGSPPLIVVAIGPEGGWVPFEIELMERLGFQRFKLGRFVLRVETAVTAVLAQLELLCAHDS